MRTILIAIAIVLTTAAAASAQSFVTLAGDHGVAAAVQTDGVLHLRGGVISRTDHESVDLMAGVGIQHQDDEGFGFVVALDVEAARDCYIDVGVCREDPLNNDALDFRGRIGASYAFTQRVAGLVEYSRSIHNGTPEGRLMFGGRIGF